MRHRGRGVKVVYRIFNVLTPETRWFLVGIGSILRLDNIFIFVLVSITYEIVIFLSCVIS